MIPLFPLSPRVLATAAEVEAAWRWLTLTINDRPDVPIGCAIYDRKLWESDTGEMLPLGLGEPYVRNTATLYICSQFAQLGRILALINSGTVQDVVIYTDRIEERLEKIVNSETRFERALSEHLAFWVYLAVERRRGTCIKYGRSMPNRKPEQQGPDGVSIAIYSADFTDATVEVHSVKSSRNNPQPLLSTRQMRNGNDAVDFDKLLDGFWQTAKKGDSIIQLADSLSDVCGQLRLSISEQIRMGLLARCVYNATVVASDRYARAELFDGFQHVVSEVNRRVATYIGASNWSDFAKAVRGTVKSKLQASGGW